MVTTFSKQLELWAILALPEADSADAVWSVIQNMVMAGLAVIDAVSGVLLAQMVGARVAATGLGGLICNHYGAFLSGSLVVTPIQQWHRPQYHTPSTS